jgi:hypothetical protein
MYDDQQRCAIVGAQPAFRLRRFAELLGWRGLRLGHVVLDDGSLVLWYQTTDEEFHLQVNPYPQGQSTRYQATVIAVRYGLPLNAVGFHEFSLSGEDEDLLHAAEKLKPILCRKNFKNKEWRKLLRSATKS